MKFNRIKRANLVEYQSINNCGKVTIDNVRRSLSTFFSWLEEKDYIIKSPMKRIHKVKTAVAVKETLPDEKVEIESVGKFWNFLTATLKNAPKA